jgi:hypothetical protein
MSITPFVFRHKIPKRRAEVTPESSEKLFSSFFHFALALSSAL